MPSRVAQASSDEWWANYAQYEISHKQGCTRRSAFHASIYHEFGHQRPAIGILRMIFFTIYTIAGTNQSLRGFRYGLWDLSDSFKTTKLNVCEIIVRSFTELHLKINSYNVKLNSPPFFPITLGRLIFYLLHYYKQKSILNHKMSSVSLDI